LFPFCVGRTRIAANTSNNTQHFATDLVRAPLLFRLGQLFGPLPQLAFLRLDSPEEQALSCFSVAAPE
jgi:hypothetical protein